MSNYGRICLNSIFAECLCEDVKKASILTKCFLKYFMARNFATRHFYLSTFPPVDRRTSFPELQNTEEVSWYVQDCGELQALINRSHQQWRRPWKWSEALFLLLSQMSSRLSTALFGTDREWRVVVPPSEPLPAEHMHWELQLGRLPKDRTPSPQADDIQERQWH